MSRTLSYVLCATLLWFGIGAARAATFTVDSKSVPGLDPKRPIVLNSIRVTGLFERGDADELRALLARLRTTSAGAPGMPLATASLSSTGGDLYEGLNVGYLFKEFDVATLVRDGDLCLSACAPGASDTLRSGRATGVTRPAQDAIPR